MSKDNLDKRKVRRIKRKAALGERRLDVGYSYEMDKSDAQIILDAVFNYVNHHRHEPRMKLCTVSRDQGETWTEELLNVAITDPELSTLKVGDMVKNKGEETTYVIVANEGVNKFQSPFQDDPTSPFFLSEGHLYWNALPYI
ncbi:hypothetical protein ACFSVM_09850 [Paenibacillus shunpengii]|uniref:Uncharacterized protein n=1 Tax=Paenibacillus shunpengii TaxID=2054424 RepID=A0ABW5SNV8_9BACL